MGKIAITKMTAPASPLIVRKDHLFCTRCYCTEPIHPGESGTPMQTFMMALMQAAKRHPDRPHADPFKVG